MEEEKDRKWGRERKRERVAKENERKIERREEKEECKKKRGREEITTYEHGIKERKEIERIRNLKKVITNICERRKVI